VREEVTKRRGRNNGLGRVASLRLRLSRLHNGRLIGRAGASPRRGWGGKKAARDERKRSLALNWRFRSFPSLVMILF